MNKTAFFVVGTSLIGLTAVANDLSFNAYHTQDQINQYMKSEAAKHPGLVQAATLGSSLQKREISYMTVAHGNPNSMKTIYFNGTHHGDEWSATEGILGLADYLISNESDPAVSNLLSHYAIYLQPLTNPDGHYAHTREDSLGRDPNRDYSYPLRSDADSFKVPEIQLVKKLIDSIHPRAAAAYHSGIEEVLWSWCYTSEPTPDANFLSQITQTTAQAMGFDRYLQSYDDYETEGEFIDYAYMKYGTAALTFEVSEVKTPDVGDLAPIVQRSVTGAMAFMNAVYAKDFGGAHSDSVVIAPVRSFGTHAGRSAQRLE